MNDEAAVPHKPSRDELRKRIFAGQPVRSKVVQFNGADIEIRQPKMRDILEAQSEENRADGIVNILIRYAFVPGTDQHVFEDSDADAIKEMGFGADFTAVSKAFGELTDVNFLDIKENSGMPQKSA